jgi:hypothetical protein
MASKKAGDINRVLTLEDIEQVQDVTERTVPVPQWNGSVVVRSITKRQMREIKRNSRDKDGELQEELVEKQVFIAGLVDPAVDDDAYEKLLDKSSAAVDTITKAILDQSHLTEDKVEEREKTFRS